MMYTRRTALLRTILRNSALNMSPRVLPLGIGVRRHALRSLSPENEEDDDDDEDDDEQAPTDVDTCSNGSKRGHTL